MTRFKIGDAVWVRAKVWNRSRHPDRLMLEVGNGEVIAGESDCKPYAEPDITQAIREVLLSDEFMKAFAAAFRSEAVSQYTFSDEVRSLEHPIPGVNRPMKSEAQLSQMVDTVRQSLTTETVNSPKTLDSSNPSESPNSSSETPAKTSKVKLLDSNYRRLGNAKDEPRRFDDVCWSLSDQDWVQIDRCVFQANRDNWEAWRKIETPSEPPKRFYRDPTKDDLREGAIDCEYRDNDDEQWRSGFLVYILNGAVPFLCVNKEQTLNGQWNQCRIEVAE